MCSKPSERCRNKPLTISCCGEDAAHNLKASDEFVFAGPCAIDPQTTHFRFVGKEHRTRGKGHVLREGRGARFYEVYWTRQFRPKHVSAARSRNGRAFGKNTRDHFERDFATTTISRAQPLEMRIERALLQKLP